MARVRVPFAPPPTHRNSGVQSLGCANRRVSAGFARFAAHMNGAETAQAAFSRPIRSVVSVGGFRGQFFGLKMALFGRVGQAEKPKRRRCCR